MTTILPELDDQGVPYGGSVRPGFGVPVVHPGLWAVQLDGVPVKRCVAFDRRAGVIWHYPEGPDGKLIIVNDEVHIEKLEGAVSVQPLGEADHG